MDKTRTTPFGVITNPTLPERDPSFRSIASRMNERGWGSVIHNSIQLGLEVRCHIHPPYDDNTPIEDFPRQFDEAMDVIISTIGKNQWASIFPPKTVRKRMKSIHIGELQGLKMKHCKGFDRLWREPEVVYTKPNQLQQQLLTIQVRTDAYLRAFTNRTWTANLHFAVYTPKPQTLPTWFSNASFSRLLEWDDQPW